MISDKKKTKLLLGKHERERVLMKVMKRKNSRREERVKSSDGMYAF